MYQLELVLKVLKISILLTSSLAGLADLRPPCPHSSAVRIIRRLLSQQRRMVATEQQQHNNLMACSKLTAKKGWLLLWMCRTFSLTEKIWSWILINLRSMNLTIISYVNSFIVGTSRGIANPEILRLLSPGLSDEVTKSRTGIFRFWPKSHTNRGIAKWEMLTEKTRPRLRTLHYFCRWLRLQTRCTYLPLVYLRRWYIWNPN